MQPRTEVTRNLSEHFPEVAARVSAAGSVFLFLDFDGTLAPIVENPAAASMPIETTESLISLTRSPRFSVAIISGRTLLDLQGRVGLIGLTYAGDHGLAIRGPGFRFVEPTAAERVPMLKKISLDLEARVGHIPGVAIEPKGLTTSVHYRRAKQVEHLHVRQIVSETVAGAADLFRITEGLKVLDIRPRVNWDKGAAARWILPSSGHPDALPIYLGDDTTDEDAFKALQAGITVRIGRASKTSAQYQLESQRDVGAFLAWLVELDDGLSQRLAMAEPGNLA